MPIPQFEAAKLAWAGAKLWVKVVFWLLVLAAIAYAGYRLYHVPYDRGVADERARWIERTGEQNAAFADAQAQGRTDAYAITDAARAAAAAAAVTTSKDTAAARKGINDAFQADPNLARPCADDGSPAAVPAGVRQKLEAQRAAAEGRAPAR